MLKLIVDTIEEVEEQFRGLYEKREDGKFGLKVEGVEDVAPLKRNLEAARRSERAMKEQVAKWEKLGLSEEEIVALKEKAVKAQEEEAERKGDWEKLKAQMNESHNQALKKKDI